MIEYIIIYIGIGIFAGFIGTKTETKKNLSYGISGISLLISLITTGPFVIAAFIEIVIGFSIAEWIKEMLGFNDTDNSTSKNNFKDETKFDYTKSNFNHNNGKYCGYCGNHLSEEEIFCGKCGTKCIDEDNSEKNYQTVLYSYHGMTIALLSKLAKIDGHVCTEEANYIKNEIKNFCTSRYKNKFINNNTIDNISDIYKKIVKVEKFDTSNIKTICSSLSDKEQFNDLKIEIIDKLVTLAHIDNSYSITEKNFIIKVLNILNLEYSIYEKIMLKYTKEEKKEEFNQNKQRKKEETFNGEISLSEAYEILELNVNVSNNEIKKQYRILAKQYHYDSLTSKELPDYLLKIAEEKSKMINAAYALLKKHKGI